MSQRNHTSHPFGSFVEMLRVNPSTKVMTTIKVLIADVPVWRYDNSELDVILYDAVIFCQGMDLLKK